MFNASPVRQQYSSISTLQSDQLSVLPATLNEPEENWGALRVAVHKAASVTIGFSLYKQPWISNKALDVIHEKRDARLCGDQSH